MSEFKNPNTEQQGIKTSLTANPVNSTSRTGLPEITHASTEDAAIASVSTVFRLCTSALTTAKSVKNLLAGDLTIRPSKRAVVLVCTSAVYRPKDKDLSTKHSASLLTLVVVPACTTASTRPKNEDSSSEKSSTRSSWAGRSAQARTFLYLDKLRSQWRIKVRQ